MVPEQEALRTAYLADSNKLTGKWRARYDELISKHGCTEQVFSSLIQEMLGETSAQQLKDHEEELADKWQVWKYMGKLIPIETRKDVIARN